MLPFGGSSAPTYVDGVPYYRHCNQEDPRVIRIRESKAKEARYRKDRGLKTTVLDLSWSDKTRYLKDHSKPGHIHKIIPSYPFFQLYPETTSKLGLLPIGPKLYARC